MLAASIYIYDVNDIVINALFWSNYCSIIVFQVEEGFISTVDEIVRSINSALHQHYSSSSEETRGHKVENNC